MSSPDVQATNEAVPVTAAILALLTITGAMLLALFFQSVPHPPQGIPLFALGPFFGASLAIGAAAFHLLRHNASCGMTLAVVFALISLLSFGPHKYIDPSFSRIWPAVITGQIATLVIFYGSFVAWRYRRNKLAAL